MRIVFLHALPMSGGMWKAELEAFGTNAVAPDLLGLGDSLENWADGVLELVGRDPFIAVGCSVGGSCALELARVAPDQVAALVLVGTKAGVRPEPALRDEAIRLLETDGMSAAWDRYWRPLLGPSTPASVVEGARSIAMAHDVAHVVNGLRAFHDRRDLTDVARLWPKPVMSIVGAFDPVPRTFAAGGGRSLHVIEDCGHYVNLERPLQFRALMVDAIRRFD